MDLRGAKWQGTEKCPLSVGWGVMFRIWMELAGAKTKMTKISTSVCPALGVQWDRKTPMYQEETAEQVLCCVCASLHTGGLTSGGIKRRSIVLGGPSVVRNLNSRVT